jgi:isocitrate lyase
MRDDRRLDRRQCIDPGDYGDGDTGHGGIMAVRRMVRECIRAGIAGIRIDDQPIRLRREALLAEQLAHELDGCAFVPSALNKDFENLAL